MKYILFNEMGNLVTRYDSDIHGKEVPEKAGAIEVSDEVFWATINEQDGTWVRIKGKIVKQPFPPPSQEHLDALALSMAKDRQSKEMSVANEAVVALQDKVDADLATPSEKAKLKSWKIFRVALREVNLADPMAEWPTRPE
jgi:hypothetical protein